MQREERGRYLIEASACRLTDGNKWQPRLTMTRMACANALSKSQSFPGLTPLFETAKGAVRYAIDTATTWISTSCSGSPSSSTARLVVVGLWLWGAK